MVKFAVTMGDRRLVGFGLTEDNIRKLKEDMPVYVERNMCKKLFGVDVEVCILYGETTERIIATMRDAGIELPTDKESG